MHKDMDQKPNTKFPLFRSIEHHQSMVEKDLTDCELRDMLQGELDSEGVVTALGYQAVLQKFLFSKEVLDKFGATDISNENDHASNNVDRQLSKTFSQETNLRTSTTSLLTMSSRNVYEQAEPESPKDNKSSEDDDCHQDSKTNSETRPPLSKKISESSSAFQESFRSLVHAVSKFAPRLEDELDCKVKKKYHKKRNLAPRRRTSVVPIETPPERRRPALSHFDNDRSLSMENTFYDIFSHK